ncbi:histidinol dehydrogenase [Oleidesulfovibrio sp.]|uniref:histidinol dehydrogenase n=1 Tax=Oleidesulfovibrio sp. TaxID=2909707 RepID=UPI003A87CE87
MPCRTITYSSEADWQSIRDMLAGRENPENSVEPIVREVMDAIRSDGDAALAGYTRKFDCPDFAATALRVAPSTIENAARQIPANDLEIIKEAAENIRHFHAAQKEEAWFITRPDGTVLGQMTRPVDSAGLYVPGGQGGNTPLISSLLMNAVPAQVAGVPRIVVTSPPHNDGTLNPYILAAAHVLGLEEIYCAGSAWAVAALAYGTQTIAPVDFIAGPGNIFVTTAKRLLIGTVGIDMIAGPSEILIIADEHANPVHVAADMLSQAEHDTLASAMLVTPSEELAKAVTAELEKQVAQLGRAEIARESLRDWSAIVVTPDMQTAVDLSNKVAPEHLELLVQDTWGMLGQIRNAGAIFMGANSPEPVGDYFAGPNHVLPTMGTARFSSALSVQSFCKKSSIIAASESFTQTNANKIARLARLEGLEAHARSVESRIS